MLIRRTILAGQTDNYPISGRYFSLIQGSNCRVNLLSNGARLFSSEVYEGMGTRLDGKITHVEIESKIEQVVEYWLGESEYRYTPPALRALNVKMSQVGVKTGISRIVTANAKRLRCKLKFKDDGIIGGDDLAIVDGEVVNGIPVSAGDVVPIESSGTVNVFMTTRNENEFVESGSILAKKPTANTVAAYQAAGMQYIDVDIPSHLVGVKLSGYIKYSAPALDDSAAPAGQGIFISESNRLGGAVTRIGYLSQSSQMPQNQAVSGNRTSIDAVRVNFAKARFWIGTYDHEGVSLDSFKLWHDDWEVIHSLIDVVEETL